MQSFYDVIKRPVISEKSTTLAEVNNRYVFEVARQSRKPEIRLAVEKLFNVKVREVRTMMMPGKLKVMGRSLVKNSNWKKAIVTLAEGHKIEFFQSK